MFFGPIGNSRFGFPGSCPALPCHVFPPSVTMLSTTVQRQPHPMAGQALSVAATQAVKVRITLPDNVLIPDEPRVASWDPVREAMMA